MAYDPTETEDTHEDWTEPTEDDKNWADTHEEEIEENS